MQNKTDELNKKSLSLPGGALGRRIAICLVMTLLIVAVYGQVVHHEFVSYDDPAYITKNSHVRAGITRDSIVWAFTTTFHNHWHPLTWLTHMIDCQLYGLNSGGHHLTGLLLHIVNSLLLFIVLERMTGATWKSAAVAALFALHPLHVESVAWVTGRKDVLSTLFMILTIWTYHLYVEKPGVCRYILSVMLFGMGLMSKSIIVTLPFVLLLLDYWPLCRLHDRAGGMGGTIRRLILEKVPYLFLAVCVGVTMLGLYRGEVTDTKSAVSPLTDIKSAVSPVTDTKNAVSPLTDKKNYVSRLVKRMTYSVVSYSKYIIKTFWPVDLIIYSHQKNLPLRHVIEGWVLLVFVTVMALLQARRRPYLPVGWFWFLGTLFPVIGLVMGPFLMADRYTYVPLIGIFIMIAWGVPELVARWRQGKTGLVILAVSLLLVLMPTTWIQVRYWKNSSTLFQHAVNVNANHYLAHTNLGNALEEQGNAAMAMEHYNEALRINPSFDEAHYNLAFALAKQGSTSKAIEHYTEALRIKPDYLEAHINLGVIFKHEDRVDEAISHYREALRISPGFLKAHFNLAVALEEQGNLQEALKHYFKVVRIKPDYAKGHLRLGYALAQQGNFEEAVNHYLEAVRSGPRFSAVVFYNIACIYSNQNKIKESINFLKKAIKSGYKNWDLIKTDKDLNNIRSSAYYKEIIRGH